MGNKLLYHYRHPDECICRDAKRSDADKIKQTLKYKHPYIEGDIEYHMRECALCGKLYSDAVALA